MATSVLHYFFSQATLQQKFLSHQFENYVIFVLLIFLKFNFQPTQQIDCQAPNHTSTNKASNTFTAVTAVRHIYEAQ
jgi:hypothetical protein